MSDIENSEYSLDVPVGEKLAQISAPVRGELPISRQKRLQNEGAYNLAKQVRKERSARQLDVNIDEQETRTVEDHNLPRIEESDFIRYRNPERPLGEHEALVGYVEKPGHDKFQQRLEAIRKLRGHDRHAAKKAIVGMREDLEKAQKLQQRGISLQEKLMKSMRHNPDMEKNKLLEQFANDELSSFERTLLLNAYKELSERRRVSSKARRFLEDNARSQIGERGGRDEYEYNLAVREKMGEMCYEAFVGEKPRGVVELIDTDFAIGLRVDEKDDVVDLRLPGSHSVGGFYNDSKSIVVSTYLRTPKFAFIAKDGVPLVAVAVGSRGGSIEHEDTQRH